MGAAGSGKTWLAKVLAEEAAGQGVPVLAVDPQGDLVQFLRRRDRDSLPADQRERYDRFWRSLRQISGASGTQASPRRRMVSASDALVSRRSRPERNGTNSPWSWG